MALFQTSVLTNYLKRQDSAVVARAYKKFAAYFLNSTIQQNIRESKEEQYQEGFLRELFVTVLGYTLNPHADYNLTTELKNEKGAKKADGAILKNGNALAVIELKGTKTKDLESVRQQAFDYKANQTGCVFVITSNFEKLRFYVNNAVEYEEFDLFSLTEERFSLLYLCLEKDNLLNAVALKIKEESLQEEEQITKRFYADYSLFKRELFRDLVKQNMKNEVFKAELNKEDIDRATKNIKHTLFKKSQKLIDRFLFIFFAEDRDLLPPNSTLKILESWEQLTNMDAYAPLYDRFKIYFNYLDIGRQGTDKKAEIFAYNGGLFKPDSVLNSLIISDELLLKHTKTLSHYDFASQVDVNILGHIFENSLNEIESVNAEIEGVEFDKQKTKRKKDGVFYTPKYITKYIVENTVGKLCEEKKTELGIVEDDYLKNRKGRTTVKLKELQTKLETYRTWLLGLTICDPACGSGAFLNQALDFLIKEHQYLDELQTSLLGGGFTFPDIENTVLENNIFGVDLNEESVEIAKLSLWLRTAQPRRKLNDLSSNIKCGNSLIDSPAVAGEKAFDWYAAFPKVFPQYVNKNSKVRGVEEPPIPYTYNENSKGFEKYGFDVVIGNPPYGAKIPKKELDYILNRFGGKGVSPSLNDTYIVFYIQCLDGLIKENGMLGFITPNTWRLIESGKRFRDYISKSRFQINRIVQHLEKVFSDATVDCDTIIITKSLDINKINIVIQDGSAIKIEHELSQKKLAEQDYFNLYLNEKIYSLKDKIKSKSLFVKDALIIKNGVKPYEKGKGKPAQTEETLDTKPFTSETKIDDTYSPLIGGSSFNKYKLLWDNDYWIKYGEWLAAPREKEIFEKEEKLIFRQTSDTIIGTFIGKGFIMRNNTHIILKPEQSKINLKYLLSVLNSKLIDFYYWTINPEKGEALAEVKAFHLGLLPIIEIEEQKQKAFIEKTEIMLSENAEFYKAQTKFLKLLQAKFTIEKPTTKLQNWYDLEFGEFLKELKKAKVQLSLPEEAEWMQYFNAEKQKAQALKKQITDTDKEIDLMVYKLYELTYDEVKIVDPEFAISKESYDSF